MKAARPRLTKYIPHKPTPKQAAFLLLSCPEAFYGGAAGGGKSDALLMAALQYVDVAGYAAILFRRTYSDLALPGALMDRATQWLADTDAHWLDKTKTWEFPSGATVSFGYLEHENDKFRYQGAEFQFCAFDELTQFSETQYQYLFSRLRRLAGVNIPLRMRAGSNPGGIGHDWVKTRFLISGREAGRVFIPAKLGDNPYLDRPAYLESLAKLDPVTRAQLERGDWDVRQEGALAKREWFGIVDAAPAEAQRIRAWDFAATERSTASSDPDYTVGTRLAMADGMYYVENVIRQRVGPGAVEALLRQTAQMDGPEVSIILEQEPGSSGKLFSSAMIRVLAGYNVRAEPATGDKTTRAMPFIAQAAAGNVRLVSGPWVGNWLDEVGAFPMGSHDDQMDSVTLAFNNIGMWHGIGIWDWDEHGPV